MIALSAAIASIASAQTPPIQPKTPDVKLPAQLTLPPPKEVSNLPVVGAYVTSSPREEQISVDIKYQSVLTSQKKASLF